MYQQGCGTPFMWVGVCLCINTYGGVADMYKTPCSRPRRAPQVVREVGVCLNTHARGMHVRCALVCVGAFPPCRYVHTNATPVPALYDGKIAPYTVFNDSLIAVEGTYGTYVRFTYLHVGGSHMASRSPVPAAHRTAPVPFLLVPATKEEERREHIPGRMVGVSSWVSSW